MKGGEQRDGEEQRGGPITIGSVQQCAVAAAGGEVRVERGVF